MMYVAIHRTCRRVALQEAARPRAPTVQRQHTDLVHFLIDLLVDMVAPILLELEVIGLGPPSQDLLARVWLLLHFLRLIRRI